jgi:hypothetical protein
MNSVGDAFGWAFKDPSWVGKIVVQGLIAIIPIVGWIAAVGWLMMAFENVRAGRNELPPAGFHLARGIGLFGVYVIYAIVLNIPAWILDGIGAATTAATNTALQNASGNYNFNYYSSSPLQGLGSAWSFFASLFLDFLTPSLIILTFHSGFGGGLDVARVWRLATSNFSNSLIAGLLIFVTGFITAAGLIACCIGVFFTAIYSISIQAGIAAWFERQQAASAAPPPPPVTA